MGSPITKILEEYPFMLLDGGFSTELERKGCDLDDPLWSAKLLFENPKEIADVHRQYYSVGADCVITSSYQASFEGLQKRGFTAKQAADLLMLSVELAKDVRDAYWRQEPENHRPHPLVAASVGPYGAYLADGSEYRGDYGLGLEELMRFHRRRLKTLLLAKPDIIGCETLPCLVEAKALVNLLEESPDVSCWMSFSAKDGFHTNNGEGLEECAAFLHDCRQVAAVGVNCTSPEYIESLIAEVQKGTDKPIIVYPNSGEIYDTVIGDWRTGQIESSFSTQARKWYEQGASIIGGCCRTRPADIKELSQWRSTFL